MLCGELVRPRSLDVLADDATIWRALGVDTCKCLLDLRQLRGLHLAARHQRPYLSAVSRRHAALAAEAFVQVGGQQELHILRRSPPSVNRRDTRQIGVGSRKKLTKRMKLPEVPRHIMKLLEEPAELPMKLELTAVLAAHGESAHDGFAWHVAWRPDGRFLASCGADRCVKIWSNVAGTAKWVCTAQLEQAHEARGARRSVASAPPVTSSRARVHSVPCARASGRRVGILSQPSASMERAVFGSRRCVPGFHASARKLGPGRLNTITFARTQRGGEDPLAMTWEVMAQLEVWLWRVREGFT